MVEVRNWEEADKNRNDYLQIESTMTSPGTFRLYRVARNSSERKREKQRGSIPLKPFLPAEGIQGNRTLRLNRIFWPGFPTASEGA